MTGARYNEGVRSLAVVVIAACTPLPPQPAPLVPISDARAAADPVYSGDVRGLHVAAEHTLAALVGALDADKRARLGAIALGFDGAAGDVNAYATCAESGAPMIAVSDGLLEITRQLAIAKAADETYGTEKVRAYTHWIAKHPGKVPPPDRTYGDDARTLDLARVLFAEELAYVIGHELGHHYLGHLGCTDGGGVVEEAVRVAADAVPIFSQAAELAADGAGVRNTLEVGRTTGWTEAGAVLLLRFFRDAQTVDQILLAFVQTHPLSEVRLPGVTGVADLWRASDGHL